MDCVDSALKSLQAAITKSKSKDKKRLGEAAGHVQTHLVLLRMNSVTEQVCKQLASFLRDIMGPLYVAMPLPALRLAAAIFHYTFHDRILSAIVSARAEQQELWQLVLYALLSGVLDYLDANDTKESKNAVGDALFTVLSDVCFSLSAPKIGVDLRCTAYNILVDASASHQGNQNKLRDPKCLGGERLGSCIWRTKDYLPLEGLLNVFARALPSTNNTASGRTRRTAFIQSVFKSSAPPESLDAGRDIADILENVPTSDWEQTSVKIVDALAQGNITYPQSFAITEVVVGGDVLPSDRLYADDKTFLANVLLGDDQYESLEFAYTSIARIHGGRDSDDRAQITLTLLSPPKLGKELVQPKNTRSDLPEGTINTTFHIRVDQVHNFSRVLEVRGLRQLLTGELRAPVVTKLSIATQPAQLETDSAGRLVEPTQDERIVTLSQFYRTDDASDDIQSAGDFDEFVTAVEVNSQPIIPAVNDGSAIEIADSNSPMPAVDSMHVVAGSKISEKVMTIPSKATSRDLTRTTSEMIRTAFGEEGDDLSDISECDTPVPMSRLMRRTSTSTSTLVRGRLSFQQISAQESSSGRLSRGRIRNTVLDSDEESPPAPPVGLQRRTRRALARSPTMDDAEEGPSLSLPLVPLVSEAPAPTTPPSQKVQVPSSLLGPNSASAKILRFSDAEIPAPDFNAAISSPVLPPKAVLKSALAKKAPVPKASANDVLLDSSPPRALAPATKRSAALRANDIMKDFDLAPASSSPTPAAKKSVKAALRKKGEAAASKSAPTRSPKRKAPAADGEDENPPLVPIENVAPRPAKRPRISAADRLLDQEDVKPKTDELESPAFRPAIRARKKYHAKGRASSPPAETLEADRKILVDYDELPGPPRPSAAAATVASSSPAPAVRAKRGVLKEKVVKEKNVKTEKAEADKHKDKNKAEAKSRGKSGKVEKTAEAEKKPNAEEKVKPEKVAGKTPKDIDKAPKAEKKTEMKTEHADEEVKAQEDNEQPSVTTAPRGRPRPRRVGAGAAKEKNAHQEAQVSQEDEEAPTTTSARAPVRTSARVAAATKDDHGNAQRGDEDVETSNDNVVLEMQQVDVVAEPPLFFDTTSPPESDETVVTKTTALTKTVTSSSRKTKTPDTTTKKKKKSSATPWDLAAERQALDEQKLVEVVDPVASELSYCDPVEVEVDVDDTMVAMGDTTLVHAPSPISKKSYSPKKHIEAHKSSSPIIKPSPIPVKPVKKVVETIDLTMDSPPKTVKRLASPKPAALPRRRSPRLSRSSLPPVVEEEEVEEVDVAAFQEALRVPEVADRRPVQTHRTVQFVPDAVSLKHESAKRSVQPALPVQKPKQSLVATKRRKQERLAEIEENEEKPAYGGDPTMQRIVDVLNDIHEVVVRSIHNRFEGVREDARASRDELLRCAVDDLHAIRAESVTHFNRLVGLEAEYAKVGRDVVHGAEDWMKVNREVCRELAVAVETHDRGMLSKKMPAVLVPLSV